VNFVGSGFFEVFGVGSRALCEKTEAYISEGRL
jgi:hypothetical protein